MLSTGRNRLNEARETQPGYLAGVRLAHAEMNALLAFQYTGNPRECTLYTTTEPCPMCAGTIVMANLRRVFYAARDPWAGSTDLYNANPYLRRKEMTICGPQTFGFPGKQLEAVLFALQGTYFLKAAAKAAIRQLEGTSNGQMAAPFGQSAGLLQAMADLHPQAMRLAEQLHASGELQLLAAARSPARMVIDKLSLSLAEMEVCVKA